MPSAPAIDLSSRASSGALLDQRSFRGTLRRATVGLFLALALPGLVLLAFMLPLLRETRGAVGWLLTTLGVVVLAVVPAMVLWLRRLVARIEEAYQASLVSAEGRARELNVTLKSIGDAVVATDEEGSVVFLNPAAERLMGWTSVEARGRPLKDVFDIRNERTGEPVANPVDRVLRERVMVGLANHTILRSRTGREVPIEDSAAPILGENGEVRGVILVFHDVAEKREREHRLIDSEQRFRFLNSLGEETRSQVAPAEIMKVSARLLGDHLRASRCAYAEVEGDQESFSILHDYTRDCPSVIGRYGLSAFGPRAAADMRNGRTLVIRDLDKELGEGDGAVTFRAMEIRALICCPMVRGGCLRAMMAVHQTVARDWTAAEISLVEEVVERCWAIIERARAEAGLRASETLQSAILGASLDGFILMDHTGHIADWNSAAARIFGSSREESVGQLLADKIVPERMREAHRLGLERYISTREARILGKRYELPALRADGTEFPCEISITHVPGSEPPVFAGYVRDISARRRTELDLRERAQLSSLRAEIAAVLASGDGVDCNLQGCCELLVEHLGAAFARVWIVDTSGTVLELHASAGIYTHLDGAHARVPVGQFKIGRIAQSRQAHLTNDVAHDPNISDREWAQREGMVAFAGYPLVVEGRVLGVMALFSRSTLSSTVLNDLAPISDSIAQCILRKEAERALIAAKDHADSANRAKDHFLAALSHELRTPLTPVLMTARALSEDVRLPADVREELAMIERNVALEARLIDDLLDLTRISKGKLPLRLHQCDAHSLINLALEIVRDDAQGKRIGFDIDLAAHRRGLIADPARFQQVIWNLLRNAVKFTPEGGRIAIRTRDGENSMRIEVSDNGIGLTPEALGRIFQPFEQAGHESDHRFGGLGLGLAIARAIVELHGGTIQAESAGAGAGATFTVELPRSIELPPGITEDREASEPDRDFAETDSVGALRLLLVEDHQPTLQVLSRLLIRDGHQVVSANTVAAALLAAEAGTFDAVVSDVGLPDATGLELMSQLRAAYGLRGIALSGYGMEDDLRRSREAGFVTHLIKPVDFSQLRRALRELVQDSNGSPTVAT